MPREMPMSILLGHDLCMSLLLSSQSFSGFCLIQLTRKRRCVYEGRVPGLLVSLAEQYAIKCLVWKLFLSLRVHFRGGSCGCWTAAAPTTGAWFGRRPGARLLPPYGWKPLLWRCLSVLFRPFWAASKAVNRAVWGAVYPAFGVSLEDLLLHRVEAEAISI